MCPDGGNGTLLERERDMGAVRQKAGSKGSLKWIQRLVNNRPDLLEAAIRQRFKIAPRITFRWESPLSSRGFEEYRDAAFLKAIGMEEHREKQAEFWPRRGPQWDGLGVLSDGTVLLLEAKAHIPEVMSHMSAMSPKSIAQIRKAFDITRRALGVKSPNSWETPFYQYANRIAHLHFLKDICGAKTRLVFVGFTGDCEVDGPVTEDEWKGATALIHAYLGIGKNPILESVAHVCIDVRDLAGSQQEIGGT